MDSESSERDKRKLIEFCSEAWNVFNYIQKDDNIQNDTYIIQKDLLNKINNVFKKLKTITGTREFVSEQDLLDMLIALARGRPGAIRYDFLKYMVDDNSLFATRNSFIEKLGQFDFAAFSSILISTILSEPMIHTYYFKLGTAQNFPIGFKIGTGQLYPFSALPLTAQKDIEAMREAARKAMNTSPLLLAWQWLR